MLKELLLNAAPYVGWDWLPAYRHRTFSSLPLVAPLPAPCTPFLLSLCALPQTRPILVPPSTIRITYLFSSPLSWLLLILLSSSYLQQMLRQILLLSSIRGCRYKWKFSFFAATRVNYIFFYIQAFKRHMSEIVEPAAILGPPLCIIGSHFCLSDCSACFGYAREGRLTNASDRKYLCTLHQNRRFKQ